MNNRAKSADHGQVAPWIYTRDAAERLEVSHQTVIRWARNGHVEAYRVGSRWRIPLAEVDRLLAPARESA
jgi:excisionase family DNA binding protein